MRSVSHGLSTSAPVASDGAVSGAAPTSYQAAPAFLGSLPARSHAVYEQRGYREVVAHFGMTTLRQMAISDWVMEEVLIHSASIKIDKTCAASIKVDSRAAIDGSISISGLGAFAAGGAL